MKKIVLLCLCFLALLGCAEFDFASDSAAVTGQAVYNGSDTTTEEVFLAFLTEGSKKLELAGSYINNELIVRTLNLDEEILDNQNFTLTVDEAGKFEASFQDDLYGPYFSFTVEGVIGDDSKATGEVLIHIGGFVATGIGLSDDLDIVCDLELDFIAD